MPRSRALEDGKHRVHRSEPEFICDLTKVDLLADSEKGFELGKMSPKKKKAAIMAAFLWVYVL